MSKPIVRPELQSRVNNGCLMFGQSLMSLIVKGDKANVLVLARVEQRGKFGIDKL